MMVFGVKRAPLILQEAIRLAISFLFVFIVACFMTYAQVLSDMRYERHLLETNSDHNLKDIFFDYLPVTESYHIVDVFLNSFILITLFANAYFLSTWVSRIVMLRRVFWMSGLLYILRGITLIVTTLPPAVGKNCIRSKLENDTISAAVSLVFRILAGEANTCTDNIFSGHTAIATLCFLLWWKYCPHPMLVLYSAIHATTVVCLILSSRMHYTVDIILGVALTLGIHYFYYSTLEQKYYLESLKHLFSENILGPLSPQNIGLKDLSGERSSADDSHYVRLNVEDVDFDSSDSRGEVRLLRNLALNMMHCKPNLLYTRRWFTTHAMCSITGWMDGLDLRTKELFFSEELYNEPKLSSIKIRK